MAYHVLRHPPGDSLPPLDATPWETVRLPAEDIVHLFHPLAPGQLRGVSWLAPVLLRLHELDAFEDATLARQKVAALLPGSSRRKTAIRSWPTERA